MLMPPSGAVAAATARGRALAPTAGAAHATPQRASATAAISLRGRRRIWRSLGAVPEGRARHRPGVHAALAEYAVRSDVADLDLDADSDRRVRRDRDDRRD